MRKMILITIVLFISLAQFIISFTDAEQKQESILAATVMISITAPNWQQTTEQVDEALPIPNDEYRTIAHAEGDVVADGLGTLVAHGEETLLVTHDHWSRFDGALGTVTVYTANGTTVAEMTLQAFKQYLRYRDGGTMVLTAPEAVATAVAGRARIAPTDDLQSGDSVLLAQRANGQVVLTEASVVAQEEKQERPAVRLQTASGEAVVGGDSGGGVWVNGQLAANMWTTVMMENEATGEQRATDFSVAAVYAPDWEIN